MRIIVAVLIIVFSPLGFIAYFVKYQRFTVVAAVGTLIAVAIAAVIGRALGEWSFNVLIDE